MRSMQLVLVVLLLCAGCRTTEVKKACVTNKPSVSFGAASSAYSDQIEESVKLSVPPGWMCAIHEMHSLEQAFRAKTPQESSRSLVFGEGTYNIRIKWLQSNAISLSSLPKPSSILLQTDAGEKEHLNVPLRCHVVGFAVGDVREAEGVRYAVIYANCVFQEIKDRVPCYLVAFWESSLLPTVEDVGCLVDKEKMKEDRGVSSGVGVKSSHK